MVTHGFRNQTNVPAQNHNCNAKDPVSQIEWLKQNAVRHVRPQPKTDRFGDVSRDIQSDTIEVFADFNSPDGYFGLTSYLQYAGKELQKSFELAEKSKKSTPKKLSFPWRFIDDGHIKTESRSRKLLIRMNHL